MENKEKDCRDCIAATLLEGELEGWVSCEDYLGIKGFSMVHSPCFAEVMCNKFKPKTTE